MAARRHQPKLALLVTILLLLLGVVAVISQDVEQEQHNVIKQEQLQHPQQHLSEGNGRSDEAGAPEDTRGAPVASQAEQPTDSQREAERLYASAVKILANVKTRVESMQIADVDQNPELFDQGTGTGGSTLLQPLSQTPLLDYLEHILARRTKYSIKLIRLFRRVTGKYPQRSISQRDHHSSSQNVLSRIPFIRYLDRFSSSFNLYTIRGRQSSKDAISSKTKAAVETAVQRLEKAFQLGKPDAGMVLADLHLWSRYSLLPDPKLAHHYYSSVAALTGDPYAQYILGFLHSTNYGRVLPESTKKEGEGDQGSAVLHYTFSALAGQPEAELTLGYRHWVGVGVPQNCQEALPWYKSAADKAMKEFHSGPAGGKHLPPVKIRLADVQGGAYGPGSSATTAHHHHHGHGHHHNHHHPTTEREWEDVLEFYHFHADRGDANFMFRIGRIYYQGFNPLNSNGGGSASNNGRDFPRALRWFMRIARTVWPRDPLAAYTNPAAAAQQRNAQGGPNRQTSLSQLAYYDHTHDVKLKVEDNLAVAAGLAAGYLGKMYLRGEGFPEVDYQKAFLWFQRGIGQGDIVSHNGLGIMYRDGLGVPRDMAKALSHFQTAAAADHPEALVNLGRFHFNRNEPVLAMTHLENAIRHGDIFQAYYYLGEINSQAVNRPDLCPVATAFYKLVAERGDWSSNQPWWEAEKAWARGDKDTALLGYWIMAERGYEVAQNNVAWILDQDKRRLSLPSYDYRLDNITDRLALTFWTRSAAQDNVDALVKMGDYYLKGLGVPSGIPQPEKAAACYASAANTHISSLALHNLGWMHENGIGVTQDFHLAKRYYDLSLETNSEAYLPVTLSLLKLHLRSLYKAISSGDIKSISLFLSNEEEYDDAAAATEGQEGGTVGRLGQAKKWLWSWRKLRDEFFKRWIGEEMARQQAQRQIQRQEAAHDAVNNGQNNLPNQAHQHVDPQQHQDHPFSHQRARAALEAQDDPIEWARRQREDMILQHQLQQDEMGGALVDDLDIPDFFGDTLGDRNGAGGDDLVETLAIVGLCLVLGWLVYIRQARYDGARANNPGQAGEAAADSQNGPAGTGGATVPPTPAQAETAAAEADAQRLRQRPNASQFDEEEDEPRP